MAPERPNLSNLEGLTLYVVRHGQTVTNTKAGIMGQNDSPMTPKGKDQVRFNSRILKREAGKDAKMLDFVSSPLHRACQAMEILLEELGTDSYAYRTDRRLMETDFGLHSDWTWEKMNADAHGKAYLTDPWNYVRPDGEALSDVYERVGKFLSTLTRDSVILTHNGVVRMIRAHYLGLTPEQTVAYTQPNEGVMRLADGAETLWRD
jgi:probable phosphoglycerate mutase